MNTNDICNSIESKMGFSAYWDSSSGYFKILKKNPNNNKWYFLCDAVSEAAVHEILKREAGDYDE